MRISSGSPSGAALTFLVTAAGVRTPTRARLRGEQCAAERLFDRDAQRGAQFTLAYGFGYARDAEDGKNRETQGVKIEIDRELEESSE